MVRRRSAAAPPRARSRSPAHPGRDQGAPKAHGPVAQLVEQRVYTAAVVGSSPAGSTMGLLDGPLCLVRLSRFGGVAALHARGGRPAPGPSRARPQSPPQSSRPNRPGSAGSTSSSGNPRARHLTREIVT